MPNFKYSFISKRMLRLSAAFVVWVMLSFSDVNAQVAETQVYRKHLSKQDSAELLASHALADTGRMIPAYQELSRYTTPGQCLNMMRRVKGQIWRANEEQLFRPHTREDTLPARVMLLGRQCLTNMSISTIDDMDLTQFVSAVALSGDTAKMRAAIHYYLQRDEINERQKIEFLVIVRQAFLHIGKPANFEFIGSLVQPLSTYGAASIYETYGTISLAKYKAMLSFDTSGVKNAEEQIYSYLKQFSPEEIANTLVPGLKPLVHNDSLFLNQFRQSDGWKDNVQRLLEVVYEKAPQGIIIDGNRLATKYIEGPVGGLEPYSVFPLGEEAAPASGKVTLYFSPPPTQRIGIASSSWLTRSLAILKRLHNRYHDQGFEVAIVSRLNGYMWASKPLAPEEEAPLHAWYIRDYHSLPFKVVVNDTKTDKLNDGRIIKHRSLWDMFYIERETGAGFGNLGYLVGKDGTIQLPITSPLFFEEMLAAYIERELNK